MARIGAGLAAVCALAAPAPAPAAAPQRPELPEGGSGGSSCDAITVRTKGGQAAEVVTHDPIGAITHPRRFGRNTALWTSARGTSCGTLRELMIEVLPAADERVALETAGWRVVRIDRLRIDGVALHQTWAVRGTRRVIYVRRGEGLQVGSSVYRAGQTLDLPRTQGRCTAAFVLEVPFADLPVGLTAGHCSDYPYTDPAGTWQTEDVGRVRRSGGKGEVDVLGPVLENTSRREGGADALVFALDGARFAAQQIERENRPLLDVRGWLPTERQEKGRTVCYFGKVSGEHCGEIDFTVPLIAEPVICAQLKRDVIPGDSGGPVYTKPRGGRVQAVGVVLGSIDLVGPFYDAELCYTPIQPILESFGLELPSGSVTVPAPPPEPPGRNWRPPGAERG